MENVEKIVDLLIGIPCSGKSTYTNSEYNKDKIFIISMDNIRYRYAEKKGLSYKDLFEKPNEDEFHSKKFGKKTKSGNWELVEYLNEEMKKDFSRDIRMSRTALDEGKRVVVDMTNLKKKDRKSVRSWFKDDKDIKFRAIIFEFEENIDLIKKQNRIRSKTDDKIIPESVIDNMITTYNPIDLDENIHELVFVDGLKGLKEEPVLTTKRRKRNSFRK